MFQVLDNDCNGVLSRTEAREAFDVVLQITLTDDEFDNAFYDMDTDSDGTIPYKEFKKYFKHVTKQKEKILAERSQFNRVLMQNRNSSDLLGSGGSTNTRSLFYDSGLANTSTTGVDL